MTIREKLHTHQSVPYIRRYDESEPARFSIATREFGESRMGEHTWQYRFETRLILANAWFANQAQMHDAQKYAEIELVDALYGDVRRYLHSLRQAIWQNNREEAMRIAEEIDKVTRYE